MITMQKLSAAVIAAALICTNLPVSDASETITARQVVQRIQQRVAVPGETRPTIRSKSAILTPLSLASRSRCSRRWRFSVKPWL